MIIAKFLIAKLCLVLFIVFDNDIEDSSSTFKMFNANLRKSFAQYYKFFKTTPMKLRRTAQ
jgi:hypothetical protein